MHLCFKVTSLLVIERLTIMYVCFSHGKIQTNEVRWTCMVITCFIMARHAYFKFLYFPLCIYFMYLLCNPKSFMTLGCSKKTRSSKKSGSSSSRHIHHTFTKISFTGRNTTHNEALNPSAILAWQATDRVEYCKRITALSLADIEELQAIHACQDEEDNWEDDNLLLVDDVLAGNSTLDISHGGGEFVDLAVLTEITDDFLGPVKWWVLCNVFIFQVLMMVVGGLMLMIIGHVRIELNGALKLLKGKCQRWWRHIWSGCSLWRRKVSGGSSEPLQLKYKAR